MGQCQDSEKMLAILFRDEGRAVAESEIQAVADVSQGHAVMNALACLFVVGAIGWGMAWSLSPGEAESLAVEASPRGPALVVHVGEERLGRWDLASALEGDPPVPLPGIPARLLGWGEEGKDLYWIRERSWSGAPGRREVLVSTPEAGAGLLVIMPPAL